MLITPTVPLVIDATPKSLRLVAWFAYHSTISLSLRATMKAVGSPPAPLSTFANAAMLNPPQCPEVAFVQLSVSHLPVALLKAFACSTTPQHTVNNTTAAKLHGSPFIFCAPCIRIGRPREVCLSSSLNRLADMG